MSFIIRNNTAAAISLNDLGITIPAGADLDLIDQQPNDIATSADLIAATTSGDISVLDPLDGTTPLGTAASTEIVEVHNDPHYRIRGATLNQLDDVDTTGANPNDVLQLQGGTYVPVTPATIAADISLDDLSDVDDATPHTLNTIYLFKGDGTNLDVVEAAGDADLREVVEDFVGNLIIDGTDTTAVYSDAGNTLAINVDDVFLRNTGDTLDSGTLTVATGAAINIASGASLTIQDDPVNPTDAANKEYVDSVAAGLDPKESVKVATTPGGGDIGGTFSNTGGTGGSGEFTGIDLTSDTLFDGVPSSPEGPIQVNDRILIKNQTDPTQNGIYVVTTAGATGVIERASDHDGTPASEVSAGNFTFVENGVVNQSTGWVIQGDGIIGLNTDNINWVQFSESTNITGGIGISTAGNTLDLDVDDLTTASIVGGDFLAFHDGDGLASPSGSQTRKITATNFINDLNILTSTGPGALTASDGVTLVANDIQLDITNLSPATITTADELVFDDGASGVHAKTTVANFLSNLNIVNSLGGNGIAVQTATGTYTARTLQVDGAGALDGLAVTNGDGVAGNPTFGLDIQNLPARTDAVVAADRVAVFNASSGANEFFTIGDIVATAAQANSFETWSAAGNTTGDASIVADDSTDTVTLTGGDGINIDFNSPSDVLTFEITRAGLTDTAVEGADTVLFFDSSAADQPEYRSFDDVLADLDIPNGITADGLIVRTAADTYASRSIVASTAAGEEGATVTNGDGAAGNPTVGVDVNGLAASGDDLADTDEFIVYDGTNNVKMTGQQVADGVADILGVGGLAVTTIGGQEVLTLVDTTRSNKVLSIETTAIAWSENNVNNNDWMQVGNANDALSGYVVPLNATIVKATMHTSDDNNNSKGVDLYIDTVNNGTLLSLTAVNGENEATDNTLDIDVNAGQKLRIRGDASNGRIDDTIVTLWLKWRG